MSAANKAKGTRFEREVADYLRIFFPKAERAPRWGSVDKGDLVNTGPFTFECKAVRSIDLASFVDQANVEAKNANTPYGVAVVKRRNKSIGDAYVVMDLDTFCCMVANFLEEYE